MWNLHGRVQFFGETDVTGVDFADVVTIEKGSVEVYDDLRHRAAGTYPAQG